jgi:sestrin
MGINKEDYDYSNVNKFLERNYKKFIKTIACFPKRLTKQDFEAINLIYNNEEILHIILLVAIIKSRGQLVYLSFAVNEMIKKID